MPESKLSSDEQKRLDDLLQHFRLVHYGTVLVSAVLCAIALTEENGTAVVPLLGVGLPRANAAVTGFLVTSVLTWATLHYYTLAVPFMDLDTRRVPFAWIGFGNDRNPLFLTFILLAPEVLCSLSTFSILGAKDLFVWLIFFPLIFSFSPALVQRNFARICARRDGDGTPMRFSIWLLHWLRSMRAILFATTMLIYLLSALPIGKRLTPYGGVCIVSFTVLFLFRCKRLTNPIFFQI
jgi:hypothetical protein